MRKRLKAAVAVFMLCAGLTACKADGSGGYGSLAADNTLQASLNDVGSFIFSYNGIDMKPGNVISQYIDSLGVPDGGYYEAKSCAFDGMDKFWYYDSFTLQAYQKNGEDLLYSVTFMDDTVKTERGLKLGDSKYKMLAEYGEAQHIESNMYTYLSDGIAIEFGLEEDTIRSIIYRVQ